MTDWTQGELDRFERIYHTMGERALHAEFPGKTVGQLRGKAIRLGLTAAATGTAKAIKFDHPAAHYGETIFPGQVRQPDKAFALLVAGRDQRKIGGRVEIGPWRGFPIFTLTLEERATCPRSCHHWLTCYGNAMQWSVRIEAGSPEFLILLGDELAGLQRRHPGGFVVRLHILGDFYSMTYLNAWARWLDRFPALHVFGYTAHPPSTLIGRTLRELAETRWDRFAVRHSSIEAGTMRAITAFDPDPPPRPNVITCPAETRHPDGTRKTRGCSTCGLCWHPAARGKTIRFIAHGGRASTPHGHYGVAVRKHGSQRNAAAALGVSLGMLQRGLRKEAATA